MFPNSKFPNSNWKIRFVRGNGDCLYESVRVALASINYGYSVSDLRHTVAKRVLNPRDQEMNEIVRNWIYLYKDGRKHKDFGIISDYAHVGNTSAAAATASTPSTSRSISRKDRFAIYRNMMSKTFWGEEISLQTLERVLCCRFLIFSFSGTTPIAMRPVTTGERFPYNVYVVLFLQDNHYSPVSYNGRFVFLESTLPADAKKFFSKFL